MRKLTKHEIDAAPDWANFYSIQKDKPYFTELAMSQRGLDFKPIPPKEFDISEYEFDDALHEISESNKETIGFHCYTCEAINFSRRDIIALAKHFKLTAEDLR